MFGSDVWVRFGTVWSLLTCVGQSRVCCFVDLWLSAWPVGGVGLQCAAYSLSASMYNRGYVSPSSCSVLAVCQAVPLSGVCGSVAAVVRAWGFVSDTLQPLVARISARCCWRCKVSLLGPGASIGAAGWCVWCTCVPAHADVCDCSSWQVLLQLLALPSQRCHALSGVRQQLTAQPLADSA